MLSLLTSAQSECKTCRSLDEVLSRSPFYLMLLSYLTRNFVFNTQLILQNLKERTTDDYEESRAGSWQFDVD